MEAADPGPQVKQADLKQISDIVRHHLGDRPHHLRPIPTYTDSVVVEGMLGNRVVLFKGHDAASADESRIALEAWVCQRVRADGIPAPPIIAVDTSLTRFPAPYFLMERMPGRPISEQDLGAEETRSVLRAAGTAIRRVHGIHAHGYGHLDDACFLASGWVQGAWATWRDAVLEPVRQGLSYLCGQALIADRVAEGIEQLIARYGDVVAAWGRQSLLHGDLGLAAIFVHDGVISGIIDWGERGVGDPIWDLVSFDWEPSQELRWLLEGYEPDEPVGQILEERLLLYSVLQAVPWAVWCHRRGHRRPLRVLEFVTLRAAERLLY